VKPWIWIVLGIVALAGLILMLPVGGQAQVPSLTLDWTAPGDDSLIGTATTYQLRRATSRPDTTSLASMDAWWNAATVCPVPVPAVAGTRQTITITAPFGPAAYYFVLKSCDEVPNCSPYSNVAVRVVVASDTTPPARVIDLIVR
jgi:hypothetical protein